MGLEEHKASWFRQDPRRGHREGFAASIRPVPNYYTVRLTFSAAAAFATAKETPRMALAPSFPLLGVPSSLIRNSSTFG